MARHVLNGWLEGSMSALDYSTPAWELDEPAHW
jgi:hypothetical protein